MSPGLAVQQAMRDTLLARVALTSLLGGAHVYEEVPRGANPPFVVFAGLETRDWSVADQTAHEHFLTLEITTNSRSRVLAQNIASEIELAFDNAALTLNDHKLINLRSIFTNVSKSPANNHFGAVMRFRAATEPL